MTYGLLEELQEFTAYVLGRSNVPYIEYNESGDWTDYLPTYESQSVRFETNGCAVWGTQNQIETLHRFLYKTEPNYSERFTYLLAGVNPDKGIDPQRVYESIRHDGVVDQARMPMTDSRADFLDRSDLTGSLLARGLNWLERHDFQHEWLWTNRPANALDLLRHALTTSPVAVSVSAWHPVNGLYVDMGQRNNHWCLCYKVDAEGIHVFDSYDHSRKVLALDHYISRAKRIWLNKKTKSGARRQIGFLQAFINKLMQKQTILDVANAALGKDITPNDEYPDVVSCAWSLSTLENQVDSTFKRIPGTWNLNEYYAHNPKFTRTTAAKPGTRFICATTPGHPFPAHCGVMMEDGTIATNDSRTGKFMKNYDEKTFRRRYEEIGGYEIHMYDESK